MSGTEPGVPGDGAPTRTAVARTAPPRPGAVLPPIEAEIDESWRRHREAVPDGSDEAVAAAIAADPSLHEWRLVDAALDRLECAACGSLLGGGPRGCPPCDLADGFRFAAREPDRPGVPPGNEHAVRVASAVLRAPHRYPAWVVHGNEVLLPLFVAGQMPTRLEQKVFLAASRRGIAGDVEPGRAQTFAELIALIRER